MEKAIAYLQETLGTNLLINKAEKDELKKLPFYIHNIYKVWRTLLFDKKVFLLENNTNEHLTPLQYQKHKELLEKKTGALIVFILSDMKAYDRNRLTQRKINFIIEDKQIFIPQLLIDLKEYQLKAQVVAEALQPAAQVIILYHIQIKSLDGCNYKQAAKLLDYSYLSISRAVENLVNLELCKTEGTKEKTLVIQADKKELWQSALPYMKPPIRKIVFINDKLPDHLIRITDINALAYYTDLNGDKHKYYAVNHKEFTKLKKEELITETSQYDGDYRIELWRYNPNILTDTKYVDPLSLCITYKESIDERIEMAIEQIKKKILW